MKSARITLGLLISLLIIGNSNSRAMALTAEDIAKRQKETWTVIIATEVNDLYPAAIQYAIFAEDPIPVFKANLAILRANPKLNDDVAINLIVAWDATFKKVTGEKIGLLSPKSENEFSMGSNEPGGQKWLMTKMAMKRNGASLCWCIPIEVKIGEMYQIKLDEKNSFDLQKFI